MFSKNFPVYILFSLATLSGCATLNKGPEVPNPYPAITNYESIFAISYGISMVEKLEPTPAPDNDKVKVGDKCPKCDGTGFIYADGSVKEKCWQCEGDGIVNEGDPILTGISEETYHSILIKIDELQKELAERPKYTTEDQYLVRYNNVEYYLDRQKSAFISSSGTTLKIYDWENYNNGRLKVCRNGICTLVPIEKRTVKKVLYDDSSRGQKSQNSTN